MKIVIILFSIILIFSQIIFKILVTEIGDKKNYTMEVLKSALGALGKDELLAPGNFLTPVNSFMISTSQKRNHGDSF